MIRKIEIELPFPMEIDSRVFEMIDRILTKYVCTPYEKHYMTRVMWVSAHGSKPSYSEVDALVLGKKGFDPNIKNGDEPTYDDSIWQIEISEREKVPPSHYTR